MQAYKYSLQSLSLMKVLATKILVTVYHLLDAIHEFVKEKLASKANENNMIICCLMERARSCIIRRITVNNQYANNCPTRITGTHKEVISVRQLANLTPIHLLKGRT